MRIFGTFLGLLKIRKLWGCGGLCEWRARLRAGKGVPRGLTATWGEQALSGLIQEHHAVSGADVAGGGG
jgi:hypothetical protein